MLLLRITHQLNQNHSHHHTTHIKSSYSLITSLLLPHFRCLAAEPAFKGHPRDQANVSLHGRCPLVREGDVLLLRITHQLNQNHSHHHTTHIKKQLQLNHIFIAASLSVLSGTSLPNRTVLHHALEVWWQCRSCQRQQNVWQTQVCSSSGKQPASYS